MAFARSVALDRSSLAILLAAVMTVIGGAIVKQSRRGISLSCGHFSDIRLMWLFDRVLLRIRATVEKVVDHVVAPSGVAVAVSLSLELRGVADVGGRDVGKDKANASKALVIVEALRRRIGRGVASSLHGARQ